MDIRFCPLIKKQCMREACMMFREKAVNGKQVHYCKMIPNNVYYNQEVE